MKDHQPGEDVKGKTDPVRTHVPGRWRITLSNVTSEGSWREHLLERAKVIPDGQALHLAVEAARSSSTALIRTTRGVLREHLHTRIRLINLLIREAGGRESQP